MPEPMKSVVLIGCGALLISCAPGTWVPDWALSASPAMTVTTTPARASPGPGTAAAAGSATPREGDAMDDLATCLQGTWIHSHEEDTAEAKVYRRPEYDFPPARGRTGFELRPGGEAVYLGIAPADGSREITSRWTLAQDQLRIEPGESPVSPLTLNVISCDGDVLRVKP
jgi:hypothetical protein